jgi:hypothetical protein
MTRKRQPVARIPFADGVDRDVFQDKDGDNARKQVVNKQAQTVVLVVAPRNRLPVTGTPQRSDCARHRSTLALNSLWRR